MDMDCIRKYINLMLLIKAYKVAVCSTFIYSTSRCRRRDDDDGDEEKKLQSIIKHLVYLRQHKKKIDENKYNIFFNLVFL